MTLAFTLAGHAVLTFAARTTLTSPVTGMTLAFTLAGHAVLTFAARTTLTSLVTGLAITFNCCVDRINNRDPGNATNK
jgi:hypothetical protein